MEKKDLRMQKMSHAALWVVRAMQLILAAALVFSLINLVRHLGAMDGATLVSGLFGVAFMVGLIVLFVPIARMMVSLRTERTAFTMENVKRLKTAAVILGVLTVLQLVSDLASNLVTQVVGEMDGLQVVARHTAFSAASFLLAVFAVMVYCIALAFEHGAALQKQSDETL